MHLVAHRAQHRPRIHQVGDGGGLGFTLELAAGRHESRQPVEHGIEPAEIVALAPPSAHLCGQCEHLPAALAARFEGRIRAFERLRTRVGVVTAARDPEPIREPRVVEHAPGQCADPSAQALAPPGGDHPRRLLQDDLACAPPSPRLEQALHGIVDEAAGEQQFGRLADQACVPGFAVGRARAMLQERPKQRVELETRILWRALTDEQIASREPGEEFGGVGAARDPRGAARGDSRQIGKSQQHFTRRLRARTEHLVGEIVEDRLQVRGAVEDLEAARLAHSFEQQDEPGRPPARLLVQSRDKVARELVTSGDDRLHLVESQLHRVPVDEREPRRRTQARERRGRVDATDADEVARRRPLARHRCERPMHRRARGQLLVIVEHHHAVVAEFAVEATEEAQREAAAVARVFDRVPRQAFGAHARHRRSRQTEEVKEGSRIAVGPFELDPRSGASALLEIAGHQRGLACSRRRRDPDHRTGASIVERREQPLTLDERVSTRTDQPCQMRRHDRSSPLVSDLQACTTDPGVDRNEAIRPDARPDRP